MADLISVLIVDDERLARKYLRSLIADDPAVRILGDCANGREAVEAVKNHQPDIVFLDIQMPDLDGFAVIRALPSETLPAIVFVTAFDRFALKAFEAHAVEYLLKPFDQKRFDHAFRHAKEEVRKRRMGGTLSRRIESLLGELTEQAKQKREIGSGKESGWMDRIPIKTAGRSYFVRSDEIDWIESAEPYAVIHVGDKKHLLRETLTWLEQHLDPSRFFRIHRSAIVNLDQILEVHTGWRHGSIVVLRTGKKLHLSRRRRKDLERVLGHSL